MVTEVDHPNFQTMLDCRSIHASAGPELPGVLSKALATGKLRHVHVNDPNGRGPGFGDLQFAPLIEILHETDYPGYISVEVFDFSPDPRTIAARSIGYMHGILESLGARANPAKLAVTD
jgi:sugar phosphate isomerase/epimerase